MEINTSYVKNEPTVGMNFFENIPSVGVERNKNTTDLPPRFLWTSCKQSNVKKSMSKRQTTLVKFQNRKPNPIKTQIVVYCVEKWAVEKTEKLQSESITYLLKRTYLSANGSQKVHLRMDDFRQFNGGLLT